MKIKFINSIKRYQVIDGNKIYFVLLRHGSIENLPSYQVTVLNSDSDVIEHPSPEIQAKLLLAVEKFIEEENK